MSSDVYSPGPAPGTVVDQAGVMRQIPEAWELLLPGDAALTRRVKAAGEHYVVQERKGRRTFSRGVWAPASTIRQIAATLQEERSTDSYARRKAADADRRERSQAEYVQEFLAAVVQFLEFHPRYSHLAQQLAQAVTAHATPVGSGTVARTQRISVSQRAEAAVIAWMRHHTTGYDDMFIPRVRGQRREVRRMLAKRSHTLLQTYRRGMEQDEHCPLRKALTTDTP